MKQLIILFLLILFHSNGFAQTPNSKVGLIVNPYYLFPREDKQHLNLDNQWQLSWLELPVTDLSQLRLAKEWINVSYPTSVQTALFKAGKLPNPYVDMNSKQYDWIVKKSWYYKKTFNVDAFAKEKLAFLSFDGIDYYAKVWLNGELLGMHEGMFGGPEFDVTKKLQHNAENELVLEVLAGNYYMANDEKGAEQTGITTNAFLDNARRVIKPWSLSAGYSHQMFYVMGMWQGARIDFVSQTHLERPFLTTVSIHDNEAVLNLKTELFVGKNSLQYQPHLWENKMLSHEAPAETYLHDRKLSLLVKLTCDNQTEEFQLPVEVFAGRNWIEKQIKIKNPKLWWPNGLGDQNLYKVELSLIENESELDKINFNTGIRTIKWVRSAGPIINERFADWQCIVNGKKIFLKGVNWMVADILLDLPKEKYDWALRLAKNMGIQLIRVWGAGLQEKDYFYNLCDKMGLMVWQDFTMNSATSNQWPQDIWESQILHTIFRVRNHPSLAVYCGGNETNPYSTESAQAIGILERSLKIYDNTRAFYRTSPDQGSIHPYPTWDPAWYRQKFPFIPFYAETGFFGMSNPQTIREYVDNSELNDLQNMKNEDFKVKHPSLIQHFAELNKVNVNKLVSRASHFDNLQNISLDKMAEASMLASGEFYQLMSESAISNFPVTTGLMSWVFKRSWPVFTANQLVDGKDRPVAAYYFHKRSYEAVHVCLALDYLLWKAGDTMSLKVQVINNTFSELKECRATVQVFDDSFNTMYIKELEVRTAVASGVTKLGVESFSIPVNYRNRFMLAVVELKDAAGKLVSRSVYFPRTIPQLEDKSYYETYRKFETPDWPVLENGPWLRPSIEKAPKTELKAELIKVQTIDNNKVYTLKIVNTGKQPSCMTKLEIPGDAVYYCSDNYFWLAKGEEKEVTLSLRSQNTLKSESILITSWNAKAVKVIRQT